MADELSTPAAGLRLWVLHGVNLDMLGRRDPAHYGTLTLDELEHAVTAEASSLGFAVQCFHTNHEGRAHRAAARHRP